MSRFLPLLLLGLLFLSCFCWAEADNDGQYYYTAGYCTEQPTVTCDGDPADGGNFQCSFGDFNLKVTGNQQVPKYTIWNSNDNSTTYKFQLTDSYEATMNNGNGGYQKEDGTNIGMASLVWNFSDIGFMYQNVTYCSLYDVNMDTCLTNGTYCMSQAEFNITTTQDGPWSSFTIVNHLGMGNSSTPPETQYRNYNLYYYMDDNDYEDDGDEEDVGSVKIDFIVADYQWRSAGDDDVYFVIECSFIEQGSDGSNSTDSGNMTSTTNSNTYSQGNGYFSVSSTASSVCENYNSTTTSNVTVSLQESGNKLQIGYTHFPNGCTLVHDPVLGLTETDSTTGGDTNTDNKSYWWIALVVVGGVALIVVVAAAIVLGTMYYRKKKYYVDFEEV